MNQNELSADLIIVGGGLAGLTAAVRAAELGLRPLLLEQGVGEDYACNSRQSGGILHIGFHDPFRPTHELVDVIGRLTEGEAKAELAQALALTGARLIEWLQGKGGRFMRFNQQEGYRWCLAPPRALRAGVDWRNRGPDIMLRLLARQLTEFGGTLQLGARVEGLLMQDGRCVGAHGTCDGQPTEWRARHCVLADGGFQANRLLVERYITPHFDALFQRGAGTGRGDGLKMAEKAGGALTDCSRFYGHLLCSDAWHSDQVWPYPEVDAIATAGIVINGEGRRCVDEGTSGVALANALAEHAGSGKLFAVFDTEIWNGPGKAARIPANPLLERAGGTILRAASVDDLALQMGVSAHALGQTIDEYNRALEAGTLVELNVPRSVRVQPHPIQHTQLMAIPISPGITYTMGGVDIDEHAQVLDAEGVPIAGLYAAGTTTGGIEGGRGAAYIGGLIKAGSFGLLAAERIATLEGKSVAIERPAPTTDSAANQNTATGRPEAEASGSGAGLGRFPILSLVVRHGKRVAMAAALIIGALTGILGWSALSWYVLPPAVLVAAIVWVVVMGIAELVTLVTELLMPH